MENKRSQAWIVGAIAIFVVAISTIALFWTWLLSYQTYTRPEFSFGKFKKLVVAHGADVASIAAEIGWPVRINGDCYVAVIEPDTSLPHEKYDPRPTGLFALASGGGAPILMRDFEASYDGRDFSIPRGTDLVEFLDKVRAWAQSNPAGLHPVLAYRGEAWHYSCPSKADYDESDLFFLKFDNELRLVLKRWRSREVRLLDTEIVLRERGHHDF